jgi:flavin-binding protein dodecin
MATVEQPAKESVEIFDSSLPAKPPLPTAVTEGLAALRDSLRKWIWVDGLQRILWTVIGLIVVDGVLDRVFQMEWSQRAVLLVLAIGLIAYRVWWRLVRPLMVSSTDDALCWEVESRHPELQEHLMAALSFARVGISPTASRQLAAATVATANEQLRKVDFTEVLNTRLRVRNQTLVAVAAGLLMAFGCLVVVHPLVRVWFDRNVRLRDIDWPVSTILQIQGLVNGKLRVPRGEEYLLNLLVAPESKQKADRVTIEFSDGRAPQAMKRGATESQFELALPNIVQTFELRARGGDALTRWVPVELVEPPAVETAEFTIESPAYTGAAAEVLPQGKGPYQVMPGGTVRLKVTANKPLKGARLVNEGKTLPLSLSGDRDVTGSISAAEFGLALDGASSQSWTFELTDSEGLTSRRGASFVVRLKRDREPRVRAKLTGIGGMITPRARLPLSGRVNDDFAVADLAAAFSYRTDDAQATPVKGPLGMPGTEGVVGKADAGFETVLDIQPANIPTGVGLTLSISAKDKDDISGPNIGSAPDFTLRVVTDEELRVDLLRREKEQRQDFERLTKLQDDLLTDSRAFAADVADASVSFPPEKRDRLIQFQKRQKTLAGNVASVWQKLSSMRHEIENNQLEEPEGPLQTRLTGKVLDPLQHLIEKRFPGIQTQLDTIRRMSDGNAERSTTIEKTIEEQQAAVDEMKAILAEMAQSESFQEAVNLMYELQKAQQEVLERTRKERDQRQKDILEKAGKKG